MVMSERSFGASVCLWKPAEIHARVPLTTVHVFSSPSLVEIKRNIEKRLSKTAGRDEICQRVMVYRFSAKIREQDQRKGTSKTLGET